MHLDHFHLTLLRKAVPELDLDPELARVGALHVGVKKNDDSNQVNVRVESVYSHASVVFIESAVTYSSVFVRLAELLSMDRKPTIETGAHHTCSPTESSTSTLKTTHTLDDVRPSAGVNGLKHTLNTHPTRGSAVDVAFEASPPPSPPPPPLVCCVTVLDTCIALNPVSRHSNLCPKPIVLCADCIDVRVDGATTRVCVRFS